MRSFLRTPAALMVLFLLLPSGAAGAASAGPAIAGVSLILPQPYQKITISGKGFGRFRPYVGDSYFIRIRDQSAHWNAGYAGDRPFDKIGLAVLSWTDSRIVLGGFRGAYGRGRWRLHPGDRLLIEIWNPQTRAGPATYEATVAVAASVGSRRVSEVSRGRSACRPRYGVAACRAFPNLARFAGSQCCPEGFALSIGACFGPSAS